MLQNLTIEQMREVLGRLYLWQSAAREVVRLLDLADRAWLATKQPNIAAEQNEYINALNRTMPLQEGTRALDDIRAFNANYPRPFPVLTDCYETAWATRMLAVVLFGQILKPGNSDAGRVASSRGDLMTSYRNEMEKRILGSGVSEASYQALVVSIEYCRDKMLAHADGTAFKVEHGYPSTSYRMISSSLKQINLILLKQVTQIIHDYISDACQPLLNALRPQAGL